jgi:hypothetical protein
MKYIKRIDEAGKEETYKIDPNKSFIALEEAVSYLLEKAEADIKAIFRKYNLVVEETATDPDDFEIEYKVDSYGGHLPNNISEVIWNIYTELATEIFSDNLDGWRFSRNPYRIIFHMNPDVISDGDIEDMVNLYLVKARHNRRVI